MVSIVTLGQQYNTGEKPVMLYTYIHRHAGTLDKNKNETIVCVCVCVFIICVCVCVCVCFFSSHSFWTSSSLDVPSRGHTGGRSHRIFHPPFCGACLNFSREKDNFSPRRIQPFLSLVDREVEFCVLTI